jgi:hypothetical protein
VRGPSTRRTAPWSAQSGVSFGVKRPNGAGRVLGPVQVFALRLPDCDGVFWAACQPELKLQQTRHGSGSGPLH